MGFTAAIIGHGRSPEGRNWGSHIDACDLVVRMWNWSWQNRFDYGTKYNYGLIEATPALIETFLKYNNRTPVDGWLASVLWASARCADKIPPRTETVNQQTWVEVGKEMGGVGQTGRLQLTRGTIAAMWAIARGGPGDTVVLVGFDNVQLGYCQSVEEGFPEGYRKSKGVFPFAGYANSAGHSKQGNHDFGIEWHLMKHYAIKNNVDLEYAQNIWP